MDEQTQNLNGPRSFEDRVFARFDAIDSRFDSMEARQNSMDSRLDSMDSRLDSVDARLERLEENDIKTNAQFNAINTRLDRLEINAERYAKDTKPIWERALSEIVDVNHKVGVLQQTVTLIQKDIMLVNRKLDVLNKDVLHVRAQQSDNEERLNRLESQNNT
jgi:chromosome segregation ATPase